MFSTLILICFDQPYFHCLTYPFVFFLPTLTTYILSWSFQLFPHQPNNEKVFKTMDIENGLVSVP